MAGLVLADVVLAQPSLHHPDLEVVVANHLALVVVALHIQTHVLLDHPSDHVVPPGCYAGLRQSSISSICTVQKIMHLTCRCARRQASAIPPGV